MANSFIKIDKELLRRSTEETKKRVQLQLTEFVKAIGIDAWRFITANSLTTGLEFGSPVLTGQYYTNHRIALNSVDKRVNYLSNPDDTSPVSGLPLTTARVALNNFRIGDRITISNSLPYAQRIENGWSQLKAPEGVYKIAADRINVKYAKGFSAL